MFKCGVCGDVSEPGRPMKRHAEYRDVQVGTRPDGRPRLNRQIKTEIPVCDGCHASLVRGTALAELLRVYAGREGGAVAPVPKPVRMGPAVSSPKPVGVRPNGH